MTRAIEVAQRAAPPAKGHLPGCMRGSSSFARRDAERGEGFPEGGARRRAMERGEGFPEGGARRRAIGRTALSHIPESRVT